MTRYADPSRCPDCSAALGTAPSQCPACGLPLAGPLAVELFSTLRHADVLLTQLRAPVPVPAATAPGVPVDAELPPIVPFPAEPFPAASQVAPRRGPRAVSVPRILLTLGAGCLLVAAVIFLAVAWSWLGIGGRTVVLVALTVLTGALGGWLGRRDLRVAAEALTTVALGMLLLDVAGADSAGWWGDLDESGLALLSGCVLAVAGAGLLGALRPDQSRLVMPQLAVVLGLFVATAALHGRTDHRSLVLTGAVLLAAAIARLASGRRMPWVLVGAAIVAALWWLVLALDGLVTALDAYPSITLGSLWRDGDVWPLVAAILLALLLPLLAAGTSVARDSGGALAGVLLTLTLVLPALDDGGTRAAGVWLVALLGWSAVLVAVTATSEKVARLRVAVLVPLALSVLVTVGMVVTMLGQALDNLVGPADAYVAGAGVRLAAGDPVIHPALLVSTVVGLLLAAHVAVPHLRGRAPFAVAGMAALGIAGVATLALYPVPLWTVVALLAVVAVALLADAARRPERVGTVEVAAGAAVLLAAGAVALPSAALAAAAFGLVVAAAAVVPRVRPERFVVRSAGALLPLAWAAFAWSLAEGVELDVALRAYPVLVVVGLLALVLPRPEIEVAAVVAVVAVAPTAIGSATDVSVALAIHLTLAGALVTASSVVHAARRFLAIPGGLLLAAATWVRLYDLGVSAPEAYTLPSATVLVLLGLQALRRDPSRSTRAALLPGLALATVPSLLWALADPISLRAALLGVACLVLVLGGAQLRWGSPVLVGAAVGGLLVLRELAPYASQTPQWIVIGLAGAALIVVGVTWEKRVRDLQAVGAYLGRLR